jgi:hypothetical protein
MFLHLPIAMMAMFSPVAVSDTVPAFNIEKECHLESESSAGFERCSRDENDARQRLAQEWTQFAAPDKSACMVETTIGGFSTYVEMLTCLEIANDVRKQDKPQPPLANDQSNPTGQTPPETTVGEGRGPN